MARPRSLRLRTTWPPLVAPAGSATPGPAACPVGVPPAGGRNIRNSATPRPGPMSGMERCGVADVAATGGRAPGGQGKTGGLVLPSLYIFSDLHSLSAHGELRCAECHN